MHPHRGHRHRGVGLVREPSALDPEVFLEAASALWEPQNGYACLAIEDGWMRVDEDIDSPSLLAYQDAFAAWFRPQWAPAYPHSVAWWGLCEDPEEREARCMALLLMHHLITDGQTKT